MNRTTHRRRNRRRKVVEKAGRTGHESSASATKAGPHGAEPTPKLIEVIAREDAAGKIELPFEIASEDDVLVAEEKTNGNGTADPAHHAADTPDQTARRGTAGRGGNTPPRKLGDEPTAEELLYNAAKEAHSQGEVRRAMAIYRELLALNPGHVKARNNLGLLLDHTGDSEEALQQLQLCLNAEPDNPQVLVNRGGVLGTLGRFAEAEDDLRRALELDATNAEAHFNLGLLMSRRGLWRDALPHLRRSIELDLGRATAYLHLGDALNHVDDLDGALQAYQRSVELVPNNAKAFYGLGIIYDRLNRPEDARQMYRRSRELAGR